MAEESDKQWAKRYLLDPLNAPEPSQETGPGSSFFNPLLSRTHSTRQKAKDKEPVRIPSTSQASGQSTYPTPPGSASPTRSSFHPSNPFSNSRHPPSPPALSPERTPPSSHPGHNRSQSASNPQRSPGQYPPSASINRSFSARRPHPSVPQEDYFDDGFGSINSNRGPRRSGPPLAPQGYPPPNHRHLLRDPQDQLHQLPQRSASTRSHIRPPAPPSPGSSGPSFPSGATSLRRNGSLSQRFPGDMSHRPLDMLRRDARAADRAPHLRSRRGLPGVDTIDSLDSAAIGGAYHHGGPYDAALASRNMNPMYSPVAAVHDSNMEALKATPKEYIQDSLQKHVPLQGTASIPSGHPDMSGQVMSYEEGADLMREPDAAGGAYKRWDGVPYHADDLKGKGEPSYTFERDKKEAKRLQKAALSGQPQEFEMQSGVNSSSRKADGGFVARQRSVSNAVDGRSQALSSGVSSSNADLKRSNTTGKRISEGLKRRFGSIRRKKADGEI